MRCPRISKEPMKRRIALLPLLLVLTLRPALAQLGSGIVYDPANYNNAVLRYLQLQKQLQQLQQTFNLSIEQYQFIQSQGRQLQGMVARYRAIPSQWSNLTAGNVLGNTSRWVQSVNTGDYGTAELGFAPGHASLDSP